VDKLNYVDLILRNKSSILPSFAKGLASCEYYVKIVNKHGVGNGFFFHPWHKYGKIKTNITGKRWGI
jgi:hypothetical protein